MLESFPVETPQATPQRAPADELEGFISEEDANRAEETEGPAFVRTAHRAQPVWHAPVRETAQHVTPSRFHFDLSDFTLSNLADGKLPKVDARRRPWVVTAAAAIAAALIVVVAMQWRGNAPSSAAGAAPEGKPAASVAGAASTSAGNAPDAPIAPITSASAPSFTADDPVAMGTVATTGTRRAANAPATAAPASRARPASAPPPNAARPPVASPRAERPSNPTDIRSASAVPAPGRGAAATAARRPIASPAPTPPAAPIAVSPQPLAVLPNPASEPPPAATAAAPVGTSGTVASAPRNVTGDEPAIRGVLNRYQAAYERLDASAAKDIWPSVNERALAKAFAGLESQSLTFDQCRVTAATDSALASCRGRASYVGRVGSRSEQTQNREWTFRLRKSGDEWHIDSVQLR